MNLPLTICPNPLQIANITTQTTSPAWLCRHSEARIIDIEMKRYHCFRCNPKTGYVKKCSQKLILSKLQE